MLEHGDMERQPRKINEQENQARLGSHPSISISSMYSIVDRGGSYAYR